MYDGFITYKKISSRTDKLIADTELHYVSVASKFESIIFNFIFTRLSSSHPLRDHKPAVFYCTRLLLDHMIIQNDCKFRSLQPPTAHFAPYHIPFYASDTYVSIRESYYESVLDNTDKEVKFQLRVSPYVPLKRKHNVLHRI